MSGVYIIGMEMPTSCSVCELCGLYAEHKGDVHRCDITMYVVDYEVGLEKRRDDCPLVPVPDHGRLIDADALKLTFCKECTLYPSRCLGSECDWHSVAHLRMMPTIIPTDKGDTE